MEDIYVRKPDFSRPSQLPFFLEFLINISSSVAIFLVIYFFVAQPHQVDGSSMLPNYYTGDYVLTEKITDNFSGINRGEVIVFEYPKNPSYDYIKRVIGVPGDEIQLKNGFVYVNGEKLEESYLSANTKTGSVYANNGKGADGITYGSSFLKEGDSYTVPTGEYIVFGDNRKESSDSREWGPVKKDEIVGKVFFRYWPLSRLGLMNGR